MANPVRIDELRADARAPISQDAEDLHKHFCPKCEQKYYCARRHCKLPYTTTCAACGGGGWVTAVKLIFVVVLSLARLVHASEGTFTFNYDWSQYPACSSTITANCVAQFLVYDNEASVGVIVAPVDMPPTLTGKFRLPCYGTRTFNVVAVMRAANGLLGSYSPPAQAIAFVPPRKVANGSFQ